MFTFNSNPVDRACVSIRSGLPLNHVFHNNIIKIQMGSTVVQMPNHASSAPVYCVSSLVYYGQYLDQICLYTPHIDKSWHTYQELSIWGDGHAEDTGCVTHVGLLRSLPASRDDMQLPAALQAPWNKSQ